MDDLPGEDDHFGFLVQKDGRVVGFGSGRLKLGRQDQTSFVVGDVIVALLDKSVDGHGQINLFLYTNKNNRQ